MSLEVYLSPGHPICFVFCKKYGYIDPDLGTLVIFQKKVLGPRLGYFSVQKCRFSGIQLQTLRGYILSVLDVSIREGPEILNKQGSGSLNKFRG